MVQVKGMQAAVSLMHGGFNGPNRAAEEALDMAPDFLAADAGSTDAGPAFLGGERGMTHRGGIKASIEYILPQVPWEEAYPSSSARRDWAATARV